MAGKIYIVLVNWNGAKDTLECLESVLRLDYPDFQVIVCDNDSQDGSVERIVAWANGASGEVAAQNSVLDHLVRPNVSKPVSVEVLSRADSAAEGRMTSSAKIVVIPTGANLGFAAANNIAMKYASSLGNFAYFWLLNNDTVVESSALSALVRRARISSDRGVVGSTLVFYHQPEEIQAMGVFGYSSSCALGIPVGAFRRPESITFHDKEHAESVAAYVVGASMLVPRTFYLEVGGMCEDYFLYFEEIDWALRGAPFGFACLYAPGSIVFHKSGASTSRSAEKKFGASARLAYQNRIRFTLKFYPEKLNLVRCSIVAEACRAVLSGGWDEFWFALRVGLFYADRGNFDR